MAARRPVAKSRRTPMGVAATEKPRAERGKTTSPETPLTLRARGVEVDDELREYIAKRAGFKLGKFALEIERTTVRLEDISGPKGAPARRCSVNVTLSRHESVVVEIVDYDHRAAFDHAMDSVSRAVSRALAKDKTKARRRS
jgi:ribosome-associated translation inhibitor RaiA